MQKRRASSNLSWHCSRRLGESQHDLADMLICQETHDLADRDRGCLRWGLTWKSRFGVWEKFGVWET